MRITEVDMEINTRDIDPKELAHISFETKRGIIYITPDEKEGALFIVQKDFVDGEECNYRKIEMTV